MGAAMGVNTQGMRHARFVHVGLDSLEGVGGAANGILGVAVNDVALPMPGQPPPPTYAPPPDKNESDKKRGLYFPTYGEEPAEVAYFASLHDVGKLVYYGAKVAKKAKTVELTMTRELEEAVDQQKKASKYLEQIKISETDLVTSQRFFDEAKGLVSSAEKLLTDADNNVQFKKVAMNALKK